MTIKQLGLILLTLISLGLAGLSLLGSWQEPQFQSRLELYQTNIALQAQAWQADDNSSGNFQVIQSAILGENPLENATKQYEQARTSVLANLAKVKSQLEKPPSQSVPTPIPPQPENDESNQIKQQKLQQSLHQLQKLLAELDLRLGILQTQQGKPDIAIKTWADLQQRPDISPEFGETAAALTGIWSNPPRLLPNSQQLIQKNLEGWFRSSALLQLYQLQQRQESLSALKVTEQQAAGKAVWKLAAIGIIPTFSALTGMVLLIVLLGQRLIKGKAALLAQNGDVRWSTPWDGETVLQVFVLGFFLMGQLFIPLLFSAFSIQLSSADVRLQAFSVLIRYVLVASAALLVLYVSIKRFFPLPDGWFSFRFQNKWFLWGLGGYCTALPIVVLVSLINQQLWQGKGGSNPLLQQALESQDSVALGIFYLTAAIAAPFFEEVLFRGFLLPSLTRYLSVWGAILVSSLLFALAHLSLSEILPLTALGIVLGVVYTRSRSLLAPMLLHSLWNSGTLLSLFILGSSN